MLSVLYNEKVAIKTITGGDAYRGTTKTDDTIDGAIVEKTRRKIDQQGNTIITQNILHTNVKLDPNTLIIYNGKECAIGWIDSPKNHLLGTGVDHYEYGF